MPFLRLLLVLSILLFALPAADAAKVKVWHQHTQSHYDKAKFHNAVVTSEGALRLSRQVKPFASFEVANVWDLAYDPASKSVYAGTGPKGKIYRLTAAGKTEVFYATKQEHILCLAMG